MAFQPQAGAQVGQMPGMAPSYGAGKKKKKARSAVKAPKLPQLMPPPSAPGFPPQ